MAKAYLFDFDGTLADSFSQVLEIVLRNAKRFVPKLYEKYKDVEHDSFKEKTTKEILNEFNISKVKLLFILWFGRRELSKGIDDINLFAGLEEVLKELHSKGVKIGVVSTNSSKNIKKFLELNKIDIFDFVYGDISVFGKAKALENIIKKEKLRYKDVLYIGDQERDISAAHQAGIKIAAVTWGYESATLLAKYNPDYLISNPQELLSL